MALRKIREIGDDILNKKCKEVTEMTPRTRQLIEDMLDTMYEANGVGLAAPQVGILKRIVVIDTTGEDPYVLINPRIVESSGEQTGQEGCLSVPGKCGVVTRPNYVQTSCCNTVYELDAEVGKRIAAGEDVEILPQHLRRMNQQGYGYSMKRCRNCGFSTTEDFEYCPKCGTRLSE